MYLGGIIATKNSKYCKVTRLILEYVGYLFYVICYMVIPQSRVNKDYQNVMGIYP